MPLFVVESNLYTLEQGGHDSVGVVGTGGGSEKIYLHVVPISEAESRELAVRVDEDGNRQHDRLALPNRYDWWIAVDGEKRWPGTLSPRITSRCPPDAAGVPAPAPLSAAELGELARVKASLPKER